MSYSLDFQSQVIYANTLLTARGVFLGKAENTATALDPSWPLTNYDLFANFSGVSLSNGGGVGLQKNQGRKDVGWLWISHPRGNGQ